MRRIEVCCTSLADAKEAEAGGAVRIELCSALSCGGVTPTPGLIESVAGAGLNLDVNVLIRGREGHFNYTDDEIDAMCRDIEFCRKAGVHGVVIGALTSEGDVDMEACRKMKAAADDMCVTFHRAFDVARNPQKALEDVIALGCDTLLTSGQQPSAEKGAELLAQLVQQAAGRITIMPGAGISPKNIAEIERITGAKEFHASARSCFPDTMTYKGGAVSFDAPSSEPGTVMHTDRHVVGILTGIRPD